MKKSLIVSVILVILALGITPVKAGPTICISVDSASAEKSRFTITIDLPDREEKAIVRANEFEKKIHAEPTEPRGMFAIERKYSGNLTWPNGSFVSPESIPQNQQSAIIIILISPKQ